MILVDVKVPSVGNIYDFNLDEDSRISFLIEEMVEMICQKEHCKLIGNKEALTLCVLDGRGILNKNSTLNECGIKSGDKLILV